MHILLYKGADPYQETLYGRVVPLWQAGSKGYSTNIILTLLTHPSTNEKIKKKNEWRNAPLKKWSHQYHTDIIKSSSPRDKAIAILAELNFDYFRDVAMVPSTYLRLVCKMFSPHYPARFDQVDASDLVPNRMVTRKMPLSSSSSSQSAKKSRKVTVDEEAEAEEQAMPDKAEAQAEVTPNLIVGHTHFEADGRIALVASALGLGRNCDNSESSEEG